MAYTITPLPYAQDALEPVISARTMGLHHGTHHQAYVTKLNTMLEGKPHTTLEDVIRANALGTGLNNQAGQVWNHSFFWASLSPTPKPATGDLANAIAAAFKDHAGLIDAAVAKGTGHFASGWLWLVADKSGEVSLVDTHDAEAVFLRGVTPLLVVDLWEHAYYLDHQSKRGDFIRAVVDRLWNYDFAASQYAAAKAGDFGWTYGQ